MAQNKRIARINRTAPARFDGGGYNWNNDGYAFDPDFLERSAQRQAHKAEAQQRYIKAKREKRQQKRNTRNDMNLRFGSV